MGADELGAGQKVLVEHRHGGQWTQQEVVIVRTQPHAERGTFVVWCAAQALTPGQFGGGSFYTEPPRDYGTRLAAPTASPQEPT